MNLLSSPFFNKNEHIYFHTNTQNSKYDKFTQNKLFLLIFLKVIITFEWSLWCTFVLELLSLSLVCVCVYSSKNKMLMFLLCGRKKHQKKNVDQSIV